MKTKERLALRGVCFALLLIAATVRLALLIGNGDGQAFALLIGLGIVSREETTFSDEPTAEPTAETFAPLEYRSPSRLLRFTEEDAALVPITNRSGTEIDAAALLTQPITFDLSLDGPLVLIVHTHATEAFTCADGDDYVADEPYHTDDTTCNVVRLGAELAEQLNAAGIETVHDETLYDALGYYDAYERAAEGIADYLAQYPSIQMVIDVHRDAVTDEAGNELPLTADCDGESVARLLLVMGSDTPELPHPNWRENLAFAVQLQALSEKDAPGVFRALSLRADRYNEHLTAHSILLEVGSAGNTLQQALRAVRLFAQELATLLTAQPT